MHRFNVIRWWLITSMLFHHEAKWKEWWSHSHLKWMISMHRWWLIIILMLLQQLAVRQCWRWWEVSAQISIDNRCQWLRAKNHRLIRSISSKFWPSSLNELCQVVFRWENSYMPVAMRKLWILWSFLAWKNWGRSVSQMVCMAFMAIWTQAQWDTHDGP